MTNVLLCQGEYSKIPYYVKEDCRNIYCIEELCYYLYHNAYLLDDSFVSRELADWVEDSLKLKELAKDIDSICGRAYSLRKLMQLLNEHIGFYSEEEWNGLIEDISNNDSLSVYERRKKRADGFLQSGKYGPAMDEYELIIKETSVGEIKLRAGVFHNLGVCAAKLFMYDRAAAYFERAYDTYANTESYVAMLSAMKLYMSDNEYLSYLSSHKETYEDSLEVESRFKKLKVEWQDRPENLYIRELENKRDKGVDFYEEIDSLTEEVKNEYREQVFRGRTGGY